MKYLSLIAVCIFIVGCSSPHPHFPTKSRIPVSVAGVEFNVFRSGQRVQAIRITRLSKALNIEVIRLAKFAIEEATGCSILNNKVTGDTNAINAVLACNS
jgi:hypothetical protein